MPIYGFGKGWPLCGPVVQGPYMKRHPGWIGAFILIAVGVIGLVSNFDLVPREMLAQIWKLWPLIPLAIGISILLRPRHYDNFRQHGE
jgi:putative Mn2+ efflux pump MntP